ARSAEGDRDERRSRTAAGVVCLRVAAAQCVRTGNPPLSCEVPGVNVEIRRAIGRHIVIALNVQQAGFDRAELVRYASMPGVVVAVVAEATVNVIVCAE